MLMTASERVESTAAGTVERVPAAADDGADPEPGPDKEATAEDVDGTEFEFSAMAARMPAASIAAAGTVGRGPESGTRTLADSLGGPGSALRLRGAGLAVIGGRGRCASTATVFGGELRGAAGTDSEAALGGRRALRARYFPSRSVTTSAGKGAAPRNSWP
jgi:hypothetical protein